MAMCHDITARFRVCLGSGFLLILLLLRQAHCLSRFSTPCLPNFENSRYLRLFSVLLGFQLVVPDSRAFER